MPRQKNWSFNRSTNWPHAFTFSLPFYFRLKLESSRLKHLDTTIFSFLLLRKSNFLSLQKIEHYYVAYYVFNYKYCTFDLEWNFAINTLQRGIAELTDSRRVLCLVLFNWIRRNKDADGRGLYDETKRNKAEESMGYCRGISQCNVSTRTAAENEVVIHERRRRLINANRDKSIGLLLPA